MFRNPMYGRDVPIGALCSDDAVGSIVRRKNAKDDAFFFAFFFCDTARMLLDDAMSGVTLGGTFRFVGSIGVLLLFISSCI